MYVAEQAICQFRVGGDVADGPGGIGQVGIVVARVAVDAIVPDRTGTPAPVLQTPDELNAMIVLMIVGEEESQ